MRKNVMHFEKKGEMSRVKSKYNVDGNHQQTSAPKEVPKSAESNNGRHPVFSLFGLDPRLTSRNLLGKCVQLSCRMAKPSTSCL